jgi:hypothetical protein
LATGVLPADVIEVPSRPRVGVALSLRAVTFEEQATAVFEGRSLLIALGK